MDSLQLAHAAKNRNMAIEMLHLHYFGEGHTTVLARSEIMVLSVVCMTKYETCLMFW